MWTFSITLSTEIILETDWERGANRVPKNSNFF